MDDIRRLAGRATDQDKSINSQAPSLVAILSQMEEDGRTYKLATVDEIRAAIAAGADVNEGEGKPGKSVLWFACRRAYGAAVLRVLIDAGMHVRQGAPLVERAVFRDTASVSLLLEAGADANAADNFKLTPLVAAVSCDEVDWWEEDEVEDNTEIVRMLLAAGADVNARNAEGATALYKALEGRYESAVHLLLTAGANIHIPDDYGRTPLHTAAYGCSTEVIRRLLEAGADVNARDRRGGCALLNAALGGNLDNLRLLLEYGADLYAADDQGSNALMLAAEGRRNAAAAIPFFLDLGFDMNGRDAEGRTPLMHAVLRGRAEAVRALLAAGADRQACDNEGKTALDYAIAEDDEQMQALLREPSC